MASSNKPRVVRLQVIELDKTDSKPLGSVKESRAAILSLGGNLGFEELLRRMRVTRAMLASRLQQRGVPEAETRDLRSLIEAYSFVERQLRLETGRPVEEPRELYEDERVEYERLAKYTEIIGRPS